LINFLLRRFLALIPTLLVISVIAFILIELPPGDYVTVYAMKLKQQADIVASEQELAALRQQYGLDKPLAVRYFKWLWNAFHGDFGRSFVYLEPVSRLIGERLLLTILLSVLSTLFAWVIAFPVGVYSAVQQHSAGDVAFSLLGYIGLATPNFMLALIFMYLSVRYLGGSVGGLFSPAFIDSAWSFAKFVDLLKHIWIPMIVVGTAGTAGLIRVLRNNLLDELNKPYVVTARSKGYREWRLLFKFPVRLALVPFISTVGWMLPQMISGATIVSVVLNLPTTGPLLLNALLNQDMYLAGTFTMFLAVATVVGTLISDILLAITDPRIRYT
jgi:peptide/nickel transport system permease protein